MSWNIPETWQMATLADVCYRIVDGSHNPPSGQASGKPMLSAKNIQNGKIHFDELRLLSDEDFEVENKRTSISVGDVLLTIVGALGRTAVVPEVHNEFTLQRSVAVLKPEIINSNYLRYLLDSPVAQTFFLENAKGTAQKGIYLKALGAMPAPIAPLAEQTRIAQKLDKLLAQVDTLKARIDGIPALLKRFRQSVLAAAVSGRLTEEWRAGNPYGESAEQQVAKVDASKTGRLKVRKAETGFSDDQLFVIPDGWGWVENHRLAEDSNTAICAGPFGTIFKAKDFRDAGVPIIFLRHVAEGVYKTEKPGFMDEAVWEELHQEYSVYGGELLVTKLGDPPGTACLYPQGIGTAMVTPDVIKMSVDERVAMPKYLMFFFNSQHCKGLIEKLAFGATRLRIDIAMFKGFPIPLPPLEEQTEILQRVEQLFAFADQLEAKVATAQARIDRLTQSILAKAFRGELVPQDPNDEPARLLLERIQAQRAAAPKAKRGRKALNT